MKKDHVRIAYNAILSAMVFTVWILSFFLWKKEILAESGWANLKYFTVESNLFVGIVCIVWIASRLAGKQGKWLSVLKYVSAVSVFVTFSVVVAFLGPRYGYGLMYYGSNLFFHLLIPLLAIAEFVLFEKKISLPESLFAMIPPFVYGIGYLVNCLANGIGSWETVRNDWYGFLEWGYAVGVAIFAVICALAWGLGLLLRFLNKVATKKRGEE